MPKILLKGDFKGECNRTKCAKSPAIYYNKSTRRCYCIDCAQQINDRTHAEECDRLFGSKPICELVEGPVMYVYEDVRIYYEVGVVGIIGARKLAYHTAKLLVSVAKDYENVLSAHVSESGAMTEAQYLLFLES